MLLYVPGQGLNSHYFHMIGDGHQPNSRGLYTHHKDSYSRWYDHSPKNATFDHGTYAFVASISYLNSQNKVGLGKRLGRSYLSTVTTMIMIMMSKKIDLATKNLWLVNLTPPG